MTRNKRQGALMDGKRVWIIGIFICLIWFSWLNAHAQTYDRFHFRATAPTAKERSKIAATGASIEAVSQSEVQGIATAKEMAELSKLGVLISYEDLTTLSDSFRSEKFPTADSEYHDFYEVESELKNLTAKYPDLIRLNSLGSSFEGRPLYHLLITAAPAAPSAAPGLVLLGGHHAREHISVDTPLRLALEVVRRYQVGDPRVVKLLNERELHVVPVVNPDGKEYDISAAKYKWWRKNLAPISRISRGVDLNRNYGFRWGGPGASSDPNSETYRGPSAFSEPETQAIKRFLESQKNIKMLISYHSFSKLILYPWVHTEDPIGNSTDLSVHKKIAETLAKMTDYTAMQASQLYVASGDTTDWSYGTLGITSFTIELDPESLSRGGFYLPGQQIQGVFEKHIDPMLYCLDLADEPKRVLSSQP